eukprot:5578447-Prymnesium_polylepis.1
MLLRVSLRKITMVCTTSSLPSISLSRCQWKRACGESWKSACTIAISMSGAALFASASIASNPGRTADKRGSMSRSP